MCCSCWERHQPAAAATPSPASAADVIAVVTATALVRPASCSPHLGESTMPFPATSTWLFSNMMLIGGVIHSTVIPSKWIYAHLSFCHHLLIFCHGHLFHSSEELQKTVNVDGKYLPLYNNMFSHTILLNSDVKMYKQDNKDLNLNPLPTVHLLDLSTMPPSSSYRIPNI